MALVFLAAVLGAAAGLLGCLRLVQGEALVPPRRPRSRRRSGRLPVTGRELAVAALAIVGVFVLTRWPVAALAAGALVVAWRHVTGGSTRDRAGVARLESIAMWTESLRDAAQGAAGLEMAIPATLRAAPESLQRPLRALVYRLSARVPLPEALALFADDLDSDSADMVVAALSLNARQRGGGLARVLTTLATNLRTELEMRRRVLHQRNSARRTAQQIGALFLLLALGQALLLPQWVAPYRSMPGQLVLGVLIAAYLALLVWLRRLAEPEPAPRFLTSAAAVTEIASYRPKPVARP